MYRGRKGSEALLPSNVVRMSLAISWDYQEASVSKKEETDIFEANLLERTVVSFRASSTGLHKI